MPEQQYPPPQNVTPQRRDYGRQAPTGGFTAPNTDNDRDDNQWMSFQQEQAQIEAQRQAEMMAMMSMDPYGWMYGGYDYYGYAMAGQEQAVSPEKWGEVDQTSRQQLEEAGAIREYGEDAILVIANGPEDMRQLNHEAEADMISHAAGDRQTVVLWNPSPDALTAMLKEGKFKDVVVSGHGAEGTVYMTGSDGTAVAVDSKTFTGYFEDSGVENVVLNMCHGAGGQESVAGQLAQAGMNVIGWQTTVKDSDATEMAGTVGALFSDGGELQDLQAVAATDSNLAVTVAADIQANTNAALADAGAAAPAAAETPAAAVEEPVIDPSVYENIDWGMYSGYGFVPY